MKNFDETHYLMAAEKEGTSAALTALQLEIERLEKQAWNGSAESLKNDWKTLESARAASRKIWEKQSQAEN